MDNVKHTSTIMNRFSKEEIIKFANETKNCTEDKGQCFYHELCPISHSTACCLHCKLSAHVEASDEDRAYIEKNSVCKDPRCFRAVAILFFGAKLKESVIEKNLSL